MQKPSYGVLVARCQVDNLHEGHLALFNEVKARHNRVILFLGQKPIGATYKNPLDFETRKAMVQAIYPDFVILPLTDTKEDTMWSRNLDNKILEIADYGDVILYGSRDSFVPHYHGIFKPVELTLPKILDGISGTDIRAKITNTVMESAAFRAGNIYALTNLRPQVKATVDIVIYHRDENNSLYFLLGRKPAESLFRFIGGFSDSDTSPFELDAIREVKEETGLDVSKVEYIGSSYIPDWRWEGEPDNIKTLIFIAEAPSMEGKADDDIADLRWLPASLLQPKSLIDTHRDSILPHVVRHFNLE